MTRGSKTHIDRTCLERQFLHQDVGRRRQLQPELLGSKRRTARSLELEPLLQLLDSVFGITPPAVERVDMFRRRLQFRHDEAKVLSRIATRIVDSFRFKHDALDMRPRLLRLLRHLAEDLGRLSRSFVLRIASR